MSRTNVSASSTSTFRRRAASVNARYIAPVFTCGNPSSTREPPGERALPAPRRSVDGHHRGRLTPTPRRRLRANEGARRTRGRRPRPTRSRRSPTVLEQRAPPRRNAIAIRWSPSDPADAARQASAADHEVVPFLGGLSPHRADPVGEAREPVALLHPELAGSLEPRGSVRMRSECGEERHLVDDQRQLVSRRRGSVGALGLARSASSPTGSPTSSRLISVSRRAPCA